MMPANKDIDLTIKTETPVSSDRKDPTSFLPEEPMSYEIKKKKKKKKKKRHEDDPFKDIGENVLVTERILMPDPEAVNDDACIDPEVTIKVENIEVELDFNDFTCNDDLMMQQQCEDSQEPEVKIEQNKEAVLLTFESVVNDKQPQIPEDTIVVVPNGHMCKVCHLLFKSQKTLKMHQKRKHKIFRRYCKHVCNDCGMAYDAKSSLVAHIKRRHGPDADNDNVERTCEECSLVFKGMGRLRLHMRRKHGAFVDAFKHVCEDCGIMYEKFRSLLVHRRRKHSGIKKEILEQWIKCPFCSKMFNKRDTYARHVQRKHNDGQQNVPQTNDELESYKNEAGEIKCKQCPLVFSSLSFLKVHMRRKHNAFKEDFRLKCRLCNLSYDKIESLKTHVSRKHNGLYCNICQKRFENKQMYLNHSHLKAVKECHICGLIFATKGGLGKHMRCTHKIDAPKTVFCTLCDEGFSDKRQLKPHLLRVHYKVSYTCGYCNKVFKAKESYHRHILIKHSDSTKPMETLNKCELCSAIFSGELELCKHVNLAHREEDTKPVIKKEDDDIVNPFRCTKCSETFPSWEPLKLHYEETHHKAQTCICQICGQEVKEIELQKHIKQSHTQVDDLECRYCDFKTKVKITMTQHMLRHKNATTLHCDFLNCRYKTFYVSAMEKHKKRHQEQVVKYQCTQCPFQTMNKYVLRYHEENHVTGQKRYACEKCEYATNLPANLIQHKYKHATEKRFKCDLCPFATKYNTSLRFHVKKKHCDLPS